MSSVLFTADSIVSTTVSTLTAAYCFGGWFKPGSASYGQASDLAAFGFGSIDAAAQGLMIGVLAASNTTFSAIIFTNGGAGLDSAPLLTGSNTGWVCVVIEYPGTGSTYTVRWRLPNVTTWSSDTITTGTAVTTAISTMEIGNNQFDEHIPSVNVKGFFWKAGQLTDAEALAATQNAGQGLAPAGTNLHWLDLDSTTNMLVNGGTAANWTTGTGTPADDSADPNETLSGPGLQTVSPAAGSTNASRNDNLVLTFLENVAAVSGNFTIKKTSDNSTVETISVTDSSKVTIASNVVTINPASTLVYGTGYYVLADTGILESTVDAEDWPGISSTTAWAFTVRAGNIVREAVGAMVYSASGGTSLAVPWPTTAVTGARDVMIIGMKPLNSGTGSVTTPSGWDLEATIQAAGGYSLGTPTADQGNCDLYVYSRDTPGTASGTLSVTIATGGAGGVAFGRMLRYSKEAGTWDVVAVTGSDTAGGSVSIAFASDPNVIAEDYVIGAMCIPTDVSTPSQFSAEAFTQTGVTFGTVSEIDEQDSGTGNDIGGFMCDARVSSGTSSAAPTMTATAGGTTTHVRGPGVFVRLRATASADPITPVAFVPDALPKPSLAIAPLAFVPTALPLLTMLAPIEPLAFVPDALPKFTLAIKPAPFTPDAVDPPRLNHIIPLAFVPDGLPVPSVAAVPRALVNSALPKPSLAVVPLAAVADTQPKPSVAAVVRPFAVLDSPKPSLAVVPAPMVGDALPRPIGAVVPRALGNQPLPKPSLAIKPLTFVPEVLPPPTLSDSIVPLEFVPYPLTPPVMAAVPARFDSDALPRLALSVVPRAFPVAPLPIPAFAAVIQPDAFIPYTLVPPVFSLVPDRFVATAQVSPVVGLVPHKFVADALPKSVLALRPLAFVTDAQAAPTLALKPLAFVPDGMPVGMYLAMRVDAFVPYDLPKPALALRPLAFVPDALPSPLFNSPIAPDAFVPYPLFPPVVAAVPLRLVGDALPRGVVAIVPDRYNALDLPLLSFVSAPAEPTEPDLLRYYLLNDARVGTTLMIAGSLVDDLYDAVPSIIEAGGILVDETIGSVALAAEDVRSARAAGRNNSDGYLTGLMVSAALATGGPIANGVPLKGANLTGTQTITWAEGRRRVMPAATLSGAAVITVSTGGAVIPRRGARIEITRLDVTANTLTINNNAAQALKVLPVSAIGFAILEMGATDWELVA